MTFGIPTKLFRKICREPLKFGRTMWPDTRFYNKQREVIESVKENRETVVPAANMMGKDYVAGFIALTFFLRPQMYFSVDYIRNIQRLRSPTNPNPHTVRVITTSVKDDHLRVLWGEINRFANNCIFPMDYRKGGPLKIQHRQIRKIVKGGNECDISYLLGMVSEKGEGMAGHHAAYTLQIIDEASGVDDVVYTQGGTWAKKVLAFGNPNPCNNFFFRGVEEGDLREEVGY